MSAMDTEAQAATIASRREFHDAVRSAIERAAAEEAAEITFVDPSFDAWPIDERGVVETLTRWARSTRRLTVVAGSFDALARRAPRFVEWRRQWAHIVTCRVQEEIDAEQLPTLLLVAGKVTVRLDDRVHFRGTASAKPIDEVAARESIDALLQRSVDAFPATTLGL